LVELKDSMIDVVGSHYKRGIGKILFECGASFAGKFGDMSPFNNWLWNKLYLESMEKVEVFNGKGYVLF
jgi:hypothetical protein